MIAVTTQTENRCCTREELDIRALLDSVPDPEVPVLSVVDLGVVRAIRILSPKQHIQLEVTPTYTGCPAIDMIKVNMRMALLQAGYKTIDIKEVLSPAWTTDWMTDAGKEKLKAYGIAPPLPKQSVCTPDAFQEEEAIACPQCGSHHTHIVSRFGSTACKALYQCDDCREPFDYFKCH